MPSFIHQELGEVKTGKTLSNREKITPIAFIVVKLIAGWANSDYIDI
jgi:hypothetical protein